MLTTGDSFFKDSKDDSTAKITWVKSTFLAYVDAYHFATVNLLDQALNHSDSYDRTFQAIPIISLIRHSIELTLKTVLHRADEVFGTNEMQANLHHDIGRLWLATQQALTKMGITPDQNQMDIVTNVIAELHQRDPLSFSFRYPFDKSMKNPSLAGVSDISLANTKDVYLRLRDFLMNLVVEVYHQPDYTDYK